MTYAPKDHVDDHGNQIEPLSRQAVAHSPPVRLAALFINDPLMLKPPQAAGQRVRRYPFFGFKELLERGFVVEQKIAHDH